MSRRKLSKADYAALNRGRPVTTYPPGGGRAEIRIPSMKQRRRRKKDNEGGS